MDRIRTAMAILKDDDIADIALAVARMFQAGKPLQEVIQSLRNGEVT